MCVAVPAAAKQWPAVQPHQPERRHQRVGVLPGPAPPRHAAGGRGALNHHPTGQYSQNNPLGLRPRKMQRLLDRKPSFSEFLGNISVCRLDQH